jgi:hypothetical protein
MQIMKTILHIKSKSLMIIALVLLIATATEQLGARVITVCNQAGVPAEFTTLTAANTAASAGDTIYIYGSSTSYGNLTIDKPLFIVGPGPSGVYKTTLGAITLNTTATGTKITGLTIDGIICNAPDVVISRNTLNTLKLASTANNCIVKQNKFNTITGSTVITDYGYNKNSIDCEAAAIAVFNNYCSGIKCSPTTVATIKYNYFDGYAYSPAPNNYYYNIVASNSIIENNGFYSYNGIQGTNNQTSNNANSTTILSSGPYPYTTQPAIPIITNVVVPDVIKNSDQAQITFKVIINN